jgi:hypothetical protein
MAPASDFRLDLGEGVDFLKRLAIAPETVERCGSDKSSGQDDHIAGREGFSGLCENMIDSL